MVEYCRNLKNLKNLRNESRRTYFGNGQAVIRTRKRSDVRDRRLLFGSQTNRPYQPPLHSAVAGIYSFTKRQNNTRLSINHQTKQLYFDVWRSDDESPSPLGLGLGPFSCILELFSALMPSNPTIFQPNSTQCKRLDSDRASQHQHPQRLEIASCLMKVSFTSLQEGWPQTTITSLRRHPADFPTSHMYLVRWPSCCIKSFSL